MIRKPVISSDKGLGRKIHLLYFTGLLLFTCSLLRVVHVDPAFDTESFSGTSMAVCHVNGVWGRIRLDSMKTAEPEDKDLVEYRDVPWLFYDELSWMRRDMRLVPPSFTLFYDPALPEKMRDFGPLTGTVSVADSLQVHELCRDLQVRYLVVFDHISLAQQTHVDSWTLDITGKERKLEIGLQVWDLEKCRVVYRVRRDHTSGGTNWTGNHERHIRNISMEIIRSFPDKKKGWTEPELPVQKANPVRKIRMGRAGIYKRGQAHRPDSTAGWYPSMTDSLVQETDSIPAALDRSFGFTYTLVTDKDPGFSSLPVFCKIYFPRVIVNPDTEGKADEYTGMIRVPLNEPVFTGFTFRREWEMAAGRWGFEVICGKHRVYKSLIVY